MGGGIILNIVLTKYLYITESSGIHGGGWGNGTTFFIFGFFITLLFYQVL